MNKFNLIYIVPVILVLIAGFLIVSKNSSQVVGAKVQGGFQVIEVMAKNGFSPSKIQAKSNTPTILRVETKNTLDCSAALFIPKLKYQKFLPSTGITEVQILPQEKGTTISASCSMGMYGFEISFV